MQICCWSLERLEECEESEQVKWFKLQKFKNMFENLKMKGENIGEYYVIVKAYVNKIKLLVKWWKMKLL